MASEPQDGGPCVNTDRHLWPDVSEPGAVHESIHVTAEGGIRREARSSKPKFSTDELRSLLRINPGWDSNYAGTVLDFLQYVDLTVPPVETSAPRYGTCAEHGLYRVVEPMCPVCGAAPGPAQKTGGDVP